MKKSAKIALITGACFLLVGLVLWGVSAGTDEFKRMAASGAGNSNIDSNREALGALLSEEMSEYSYMASGQVSGLNITLQTRNVYVIPADVSSIEIKSTENDESKLKASLESGELKLEEELKRNFVNISDFISFDFTDKSADRAVYIYLPKDTELESLKVDCSYGNITLRDFTADELVITGESGDIDISGIPSKSAAIDSSFGDIVINKLTVEGRLFVAASNGKISIKNSALSQAGIESSFGSISLSEVSISVGELSIDSSNGSVDIENVTGKDMHISTSFGDINIEDSSAGNITADSDNGNIEVDSVSAAAVKLTNSFGGIDVEDSFLASLYAETDNGSVKIVGGDIASIDSKTSFGSIGISSTSFESCIANSQNGDVTLEKLAMSQNETSIKAKTASGSVSIGGERQANSYEKTLSGAKVEIDAKTSFGDVIISFK
ncbi:MAG: DUF4097 family beta strand repeat-containing protein [Christensenellales bacterium]|jgi:DUF4097 and DUF4098 domain-containing protein YvlB